VTTGNLTTIATPLMSLRQSFARLYSPCMVIGERIRQLREAKNLSQGDIEQRTGLFRCYTSRVENGHTVPSIETLEKYARALEVPLYRLFYEGDEPPKKPKLPSTETAEPMWGAKGDERRELRSFAKALSRMDDRQRRLLLAMVQRMAGRSRGGARRH
jgi:transcriptional regulator with XRE-family HTH domain